MKHKAVITGIGLITPCGEGQAPLWEFARSGRSSIRSLPQFSSKDLPGMRGGLIDGFDPRQHIKQRKSIKVMSREIQLAVAASGMALQDAGLETGSFEGDLFGVTVGCGIINTELDEMGAGIREGVDHDSRFQMSKFGEDGIRALFPLWFLKYLPNMPACHISIAYGLRGPSNTLTTSTAAAAQAIGEAARVIERGDAVWMLAGGTDSKLNGMGLSRLHLLGLLAKEGKENGDAYVPFDSDCQGIVPGEGAGFFVLESEENAIRRGAKIYAEVAGYGSSAGRSMVLQTNLDSEGPELSMKRALKDAGISPDSVGFLMANASGLPLQDMAEAWAIRHVFGQALQSVTVTACKPVTGHLLYASAAAEVALAIAALEANLVPPMPRVARPRPHCDLPFSTGSLRLEEQSVLINSFGFGGQNASLVLKVPS